MASGRAGLLGAHRENGHFVRWIRPVIAILTVAKDDHTVAEAGIPGQGGVKINRHNHHHQLLVLFLEELAADAAAVHRRAAAFVGLAPSELSFSSGSGRGDNGPRTRGGGVGVSVVNRGGASQSAGRHIEEQIIERATCAVEGEGKGGDVKEFAEIEEKDYALLLQLDEYYEESTTELNELLLSALGVRNTWWPQRTPASF